MSMSIVHHVREKSQAKGSARTLLLNLAIYANDCCGVAWPADATLYHDINVSRQRIHELKNALERTGELVILERPGATNLYFVAWQGQPLGGTSRDTGQHDPRCPVRHPHLAVSGAALEGDDCLTHDGGEGSECSDPREDYALNPDGGVSDAPDPQGSEIADGGGQISLTQKQEKTMITNVNVECIGFEANVTRPVHAPVSLSPGEEHVIEQCVQTFDDARSRRCYQRIISVLGDQVVYGLLRQTLEQQAIIRGPKGAYFVHLAKREAARQGLDLGFATTATITATSPVAMMTEPVRPRPDHPFWCDQCGVSHATLACP